MKGQLLWCTADGCGSAHVHAPLESRPAGFHVIIYPLAGLYAATRCVWPWCVPSLASPQLHPPLVGVGSTHRVHTQPSSPMLFGAIYHLPAAVASPQSCSLTWCSLQFPLSPQCAHERVRHPG